MSDIPTIIVTRYRDQFTFKCPACKRWHYHGAVEGPRVANCRSGAFPNGYILKLADDDAAPAERAQ